MESHGVVSIETKDGSKNLTVEFSQYGSMVGRLSVYTSRGEVQARSYDYLLTFPGGFTAVVSEEAFRVLFPEVGANRLKERAAQEARIEAILNSGKVSRREDAEALDTELMAKDVESKDEDGAGDSGAGEVSDKPLVPTSTEPAGAEKKEVQLPVVDF